jgi:adenylate cyclase
VERQADKRRLTAILVADVVGYSRLMGEDESGTVASLKEHRAELLEPKASQYNGRIIKLMGDGVLMEFDSVVEAVAFAVEVQCAIQGHNADLPEQRKVLYRVGLNIGDVIVEGDDIYGDGVNVAARLEGLSDAGGICITGNVRDQIRDKLDLNFENLGDVEVKNIARPVSAFKVVMDDKAIALTTPIVQVAAQPARSSRMIIGAAMGLVILALGAGLWSYQSQPGAELASVAQLTQPLADKPSIAVLPFLNMSGDKQQEYFSDGITEDIIIDLSKIGGLLVIARHSSFLYKSKSTNIRDISRELGVQHILKGSVRKAGGRVRITAQLIDGETGDHIWAERYDRDLVNIFAIQDAATKKIVAALAVKLGAREKASLDRTVRTDPDAYDMLLRGVARLRRYTRETNAEARAYFEKALAIDPSYGRAYANLGFTHVLDVLDGYSLDPKTSLALAEKALDEAVRVNDTLPQIYSARSTLFRIRRQYDRSLADSRKILQLDPNNDQGYATMAFTLNYMGRPKDGLAAIKKALRLNPHTPYFYLFAQGMSLFQLERHEDAAAVLQKLVERNPGFIRGHLLLAATYGHLGRNEDAEWAAQEALTLLPGLTISQRRKIVPYGREVDINRYLSGLRKAGLPE